MSESPNVITPRELQQAFERSKDENLRRAFKLLKAALADLDKADTENLERFVVLEADIERLMLDAESYKNNISTLNAEIERLGKVVVGLKERQQKLSKMLGVRRRYSIAFFSLSLALALVILVALATVELASTKTVYQIFHYLRSPGSEG